MNFYLVINRKFRLTVIYWRCYSIINFQFFSPHLVFKSLWRLLRTVLLNWNCKNKAWSCKRFNTYLAWKKSSRIVLYDFSPPFLYLFCLLKYCLDQMYFSYRFDTKPLFTCVNVHLYLTFKCSSQQVYIFNYFHCFSSFPGELHVEYTLI